MLSYMSSGTVDAFAITLFPDTRLHGLGRAIGHSAGSIASPYGASPFPRSLCVGAWRFLPLGRGMHPYLVLSFKYSYSACSRPLSRLILGRRGISF